MELELEDVHEFLQSAEEIVSSAHEFDPSISGPTLLTFLRKCLFVFLQANCTGPPLDLPPGDRSRLSLDGEDATSNLVGAQYLATASELVRVLPTQTHFPSIEACQTGHLWAARTLAVHQHCLCNAVPTLKSLILLHYDQAINSETDPQARAELCIEASHPYLFYYKYTRAQELLTEAQELAGLKFWLTGKMGYRTKYQKTPTAQLVLETETKREAEEESKRPETVSLDFDRDNVLHETPVLVEPVQTLLAPLDQCLLLAVVQHHSKSRHGDETQREVIAAYLDSTLQQSLNWLVYSTSLLYRCRNQFHDYKTK